MGRRHLHLQLRNGTYRLRVRVPRALRALVGKREITKSLQTGDLKEAQELARFERVRLDGEWAMHRQRLTPKNVERLSDRQIWYLVSKWFVEREKQNSTLPPLDNFEDALVELCNVSTWEMVGSYIGQDAQDLARSEGFAVEPSSESHLRLIKMLFQANIELERRNIARSFPTQNVPVDPNFASLSKNSILQPVAKFCSRSKQLLTRSI